MRSGDRCFDPEPCQARGVRCRPPVSCWSHLLGFRTCRNCPAINSLRGRFTQCYRRCEGRDALLERYGLAVSLSRVQADPRGRPCKRGSFLPDQPSHKAQCAVQCCESPRVVDATAVHHTDTSLVQASSDGPAIQGVKLREGLQHAAEHPGDVLGKAAQYVKDLAADRAGEQASSKPAVEAVKLRKGFHDDEPEDAKKGPAIEPVKLKAQSGGPAITPVKLRQAVQDAAADPGAALGNAAQVNDHFIDDPSPGS